MARHNTLIVAAALAFAVAVAGGYRFGQHQATAPTSGSTSTSLGPVVQAARDAMSLPAGHAGRSVTAPQLEGKLAPDPSAKFIHFRVGNKNVKRLFVDGDTVWVGTTGGLVRYNTRNDEYRMFDVSSGLLSNGVFYVGKLDGRIVVGTYGGGLSLLDPVTQKWDTYNIPDGLGDAFVYDVLKASNGDVWIATWSGVNRVRGGQLKDRASWELHTVASTQGGLPNDWVYGLAEGRDGDIWLGTEGGLAQYRQGRWQHWNHAQGLGADYERVKNDIQFKTDPSKVSEHHARQKEEMGLSQVDVAYNPNYIVSMVVDAQGVVWAGTWGAGLSRFDGKTWTQRTVADGLPGNHVFMLHLDPTGQLWVGTNNGLAKLHDGKFELLTVQDGLFSNTVFSMATTRDGSLWVGGFGGVAKIRRR
jgi:ligand-binding sensor domain-containing protein